jgi:nicotinamide-nucleotide amidase
VTKFNWANCDTNSGFIAKSLDKIGVEINEMISISDNKKTI